ncbi:hypothetical protein [Dactylosporangium sp. CA-092794]|uniref:hypothetical protein n=1 Tax=Dactylosporangium sp. CA-092794 TaxID=3239929 RepID=UPI003D94AE50
MDYTSPGGGRSVCPPDPDNVAAGVHVPRRRAAATRHDPTPGPVTDEATEPAARDWFATYRTTPEAVWTIAATADTDVPLRLGISALGGGTVGRAYANNGWIYGLWHGERLRRCGADLRSNGIGQTHQQMAVLLADHLATDEALDAGIRARLTAWLAGPPASPDLP